MYIYNYTDHLGNIRLSYQKNTTGALQVLEESNYYPFGMKHTGYNSINAQAYNYKYNGKELQDELNLNVYDYGARNYDPALGRWFGVDPLAEKYLSITSYAYTANNPVYFIDPNGMSIDPNNPTVLPEITVVGKRQPRISMNNFINTTFSFVSRFQPQWTRSANITRTYNKALSTPQARHWYHNLHKNDNRDALIVGGVIVLAPIIIESGTVALVSYTGEQLFTNATISISTQLAINQDVNLVQLAGDIAFTPLVGNIIGSSSNLSVRGMIEDNSTIPVFHISTQREFAIGVTTGVIPGLAKSRFTGAINSIEDKGSKKMVNVMLDTNYQLISQSINNATTKKQ